MVTKKLRDFPTEVPELLCAAKTGCCPFIKNAVYGWDLLDGTVEIVLQFLLILLFLFMENQDGSDGSGHRGGYCNNRDQYGKFIQLFQNRAPPKQFYRLFL